MRLNQYSSDFLMLCPFCIKVAHVLWAVPFLIVVSVQELASQKALSLKTEYLMETFSSYVNGARIPQSCLHQLRMDPSVYVTFCKRAVELIHQCTPYATSLLMPCGDSDAIRRCFLRQMRRQLGRCAIWASPKPTRCTLLHCTKEVSYVLLSIS